MPTSTSRFTQQDFTQQEHTFHLSCAYGLEQLLADEALKLGFSKASPRHGRVTAQGNLTAGYKAVLWSRLASRVLLQIGQQTDIDNAASLNAWLSRFKWEDHLTADGSLAIDVLGTNPELRNTHNTALQVKDAAVDYFKEKFNRRPRVEKFQPDARFHLRLEKNNLGVLSLDLSGVSLHQRGYRLEAGAAPLRETLAAALLIRAGWPEKAEQGWALVDPFCGSGTLLVEAALMQLDVAPGLLRPWHGLESWPVHAGKGQEIWQQLLEEAKTRRAAKVDSQLLIFGADNNPQVLDAAFNNLTRAGLAERILLNHAKVEDLTLPAGLSPTSQGLLITNPPYGERLEDLPQLASTYAALGNKFAEELPNWELAVITNNADLAHRIPFRPHKSYAFKNAKLDCRFYLFNPALNNSAVKRATQETATSSEQTAATSNEKHPAQDLANRIAKNMKRLRRWLNKENIRCYRLYDADLPEFNLAIDIYNDQAHIQEYAPPAKVNPNRAQQRLMQALEILPQALGLPAKNLHLKTRSRQRGKEQYQKQSSKGNFFAVQEGQIQALVNLTDYLDTGLFLDHRPVRLRLAQEAKGKRVLNLYCYTGVASLHALGGGATSVTNVDLSNTYLNWLEENLQLNGFNKRKSLQIQADVRAWLAKENHQYDLIFLDPPSFSNSKQMQGTLDIQRDHAELIYLAMARLKAGGKLIFSTNLRSFKLSPAVSEQWQVENISHLCLDPDFERNPKIHQVYELKVKS